MPAGGGRGCLEVEVRRPLIVFWTVAPSVGDTAICHAVREAEES